MQIRKSEELQFRLEEETIEKTTLENQKTDVEERIFELEEALAAAKETNERMESQLSTIAVNKTDSTESSTKEVHAKLAASEARVAELEASLVTLQGEQLSLMNANSEITAKDTQIQQLQAKLSALQEKLLQADQKLSEKNSTEEELKAAKIVEDELRTALNHQKALLKSEEERSKSEEVNSLVTQLALAEGELISMRAKVSELQKQVTMLESAKLDTEKFTASAANPLASLQSLLPDAILDEVQSRIEKEKEIASEDSEKWTKRLLDLAEELRKIKGLEREPDEATTEALQKMSIKLLEAETELVQKESATVEQMAALTQAHIELQKAQEEPPSQVLVAEELQKRLEVLDAERSQLVTSLSERQQEVLSLQHLLNQKGSEAEIYSQKLSKLQSDLDAIVSERDRKLNELKAALSNKEGLVISDEELLQRITHLRLHNEELEKLYTASEARIKSLTYQHSKVEEEYQALKKAASSMSSIDEQITAMQCALEAANYRAEMAERSSSTALKQLESKNLELQSLQERLLKLAKDHEEFQDKQMQLVTSLETEKRICMERVRRAEKKVDRLEKEAQSKPFSSNAASPPPPIPNGRGTPRTPTVVSNNDSYDGQVNFLNSIIVDLHAKNAELEQRLRTAILNSGEKSRPSEEQVERRTKKASQVKMRFWCDICEVFDLHDTEQCPEGRSQFNERRSFLQPKLAKNVTPSADRLYCENCGVFDSHITTECTEDPQETF